MNAELSEAIKDYYRDNLSDIRGVVMIDMYNKFSYIQGRYDTTTLYVYSAISKVLVCNDKAI